MRPFTFLGPLKLLFDEFIKANYFLVGINVNGFYSNNFLGIKLILKLQIAVLVMCRLFGVGYLQLINLSNFNNRKYKGSPNKAKQKFACFTSHCIRLFKSISNAVSYF